jgi:hypothetical protein
MMNELVNEVKLLSRIATITYGDGFGADEITKKEIIRFYETYPAIQWDVYLIKFFESFLALDILDQDENIIACVFGFDQNVTESILNPDEPLINEDGFLRFSESSIKLRENIRIGFNFAYDITGKRPNFIYFRYSIAGIDSTKIKYRPFSNNFLEWVTQFRETKGLTLNSVFDIY